MNEIGHERFLFLLFIEYTWMVRFCKGDMTVKQEPGLKKTLYPGVLWIVTDFYPIRPDIYTLIIGTITLSFYTIIAYT
jgi:hypothetical protein